MRARQLLAVLVAVSLLGAAVPGGALAASATGGPATAQATDQTADGDSTGNASAAGGATERATVGQQLATVIAVTDDEVSAEVEAASLAAAFESGTESERAALLAERAQTLRDRADAVVADRDAAREAYAAGNLTRGEFAQRLAALAGRAATVQRGFDRIDDRADDVSAFELRAAGYDRSANEAARDRLNRVADGGARALLAQYTGERRGAFTVDDDEAGLSIEVEGDDGERSREFERDRPGNGTFAVSQSLAVAAATDALADDLDGSWVLRSADRDDDGYYEFEFSFRGSNATGEAEVSVDGETGTVFALEEELEPRERDDGGDVGDEDRPLSITIADGTAAPNETVTLAVAVGGDPVANATVTLGDRVVGETDADGRITLTLPDAEEAEIEAEAGDNEGELELRLRATDADEAADAAIGERLSVTGSVDNGTATVAVAYDGEPAPDVTVLVDGERVGETDADGRVSFGAPEEDEFEVTLFKGAFEAELSFEPGADGTLAAGDIDVDEREVDEDDDDEREDEDQEADESEDGDGGDDDEREDEDGGDDDAESEDEDDSDTEDESEDDD